MTPNRSDDVGGDVAGANQGLVKRSPVMADVAARAGVSHQTVSRVLNEPSLVRPSTRKRVEQAIAELGYRRNMSARALATKRSSLIGVVSPAVTLFGPSQMATAIQAAARSSGYATISATPEPTSPTEVLDFFLTLGVEGIIVIAPTRQTATEARRLAGTLPVVAVAAGMRKVRPLHVVAIDNEQGARDATRHLIDLGHEQIAHIAGPRDWFDARARIQGWQAELASAGLAVPEVTEGGGWGAADGYAAAQELLALPSRPTAVFAANDDLALGAMRALHHAGLRIPEDVAVVGYDDVANTAFYEPPLTTVRQPFDDLGRHALEALVATIEGRRPEAELSPPQLVVRESSVGSAGG